MPMSLECRVVLSYSVEVPRTDDEDETSKPIQPVVRRLMAHVFGICACIQ